MRALLPAALDLAAPLLSSAMTLVRQLALAALMGTLFVLAVWLLCRLAPRLPAGLRCALWWLASLKLLLGLVWPAPLTLPLLPAAAAPVASWLAPPAPAPTPALVQPTPLPRLDDRRLAGGATGPVAAAPAAMQPVATQPITTGLIAPGESAPSAPAAPRSTVPFGSGAWQPTGPAGSAASAAAGLAAAQVRQSWWVLALAGLWLAGVLRQALLTARELRLVRRFLAGSVPVTDEAILALAAELRGRLKMAPVELRAAPTGGVLAAPLTAGALHPVVVLPAAGIDRLSRQELAMTLGHELMHVRRRDLVWGWIPAAAARLFFFLPPAALAAREYALAREAACDAAVLRLLGTSPASYGRLLLRLGVCPASSRRRSRTADLAPAAATAGGAAASLQQLKRRLEMLQHHPQACHDVQPRPTPLRRLGLSILALLAVAALVPMRLVTAAQAAAAPGACSSVVASGPAPASPVIAAALLPTAAPADAGMELAMTAAGAGVRLSSLGRQAQVGVGTGAGVRLVYLDRQAQAGAGTSRSSGPDDADDAAEPALAPEPPSPPDAPPAAPAPPAPPAPAVWPAPPAPAVAAPPPTPPAPPASPAPPSEPRRAARLSSGASHLHSDRPGRRHEDSFVLLHGGSDVTMSGDVASVERARKLQREAGGGDLLWVRHGGKEYVIRDPAILAEVREIFRPQAELGARQGKLGGEQGALGAKQGELGSRQGSLGAQQGKLGAQQALLGAEEAKLTVEGLTGDDRGSEARAKRRDELIDQQVQLAGEMRKLDEQQRELGRQQRELGESQRKLGDQQRELGREQERVGREAEAKLQALIVRSIAAGTAHEVK